MTDHQDPNSAFSTSPLLIVEAFLDGEQVNAEELKHALADAEARAHLVEVLVLHQTTAEIMSAKLDSAAPVRRTTSRIRWIAAAAAIAGSVWTGHLMGQRAAIPVVEASAVETFVQVDTSPPPPTPTYVVRLTPGVDWTDHQGGQ
jgi:hypothetical protein